MVRTVLVLFTLISIWDGWAQAASGPEIISSSQKEIRQVVNSNMKQVKRCYVDKYFFGRSSRVKVSLAITTDGWGKVSSIKLIEVAHSHKKRSPKPFLHCLFTAIYNWQFPITGAKSRRFVQDFQIGS